MNKFSLFDYLSFILPGGTFIGITLSIIRIAFPKIYSPEVYHSELLIIPFVVAAYLIGHLCSLVGTWFEKKFKVKTPFWMLFLQNNPNSAQQIDSLSIKIFNTPSFRDRQGDILPSESGNAFDTIYDFIEVKEKDAKIKGLMSQYVFFRNLMGVCFLLLVFQLSLILLNFSDMINLQLTMTSHFLLLASFVIIFFFSLVLRRQRKILMMQYVYRTFLALSIQS